MKLIINKIFYVILIIVAVFPVFRTIVDKWDYYQEPFDLNRASKLYGMSQYVQKENASWIADEIVLSYASWYYIQGGSPIIVNSDYPPLGKYLVGISIFLFNNEKIPNIIFGIFSLISFFLLSNYVLKNWIIALIPVGLLAWERLFNEQLIFVPLFETFVLPFYLLATLFFLKGLKNHWYFIVSSILVGFCWSIKPWMFTIPLLLSWLVYLLFVRRKIINIVLWTSSLLFALIILLSSYFQLFAQGWNIIKVLSVQKWILWYYANGLTKIGSFWPFIYLNKWYVWWGDNLVLSIDQWTIVWPIFMTLGIICIIIVGLKFFGLRNNMISRIFTDNIIYVFCLQLIAYIGFFTFGYMSTRYLFYFMPICYILGVYLFKNIFTKND